MFMPFTQPRKFSGVKSVWIGDTDTAGLLHGSRKTQKKQSTDSFILLIFFSFTYIENLRFSFKVLGF